MSNIDKRALREVAERATPGTWRRTSSLFNGITVTPFSLCGEEVTLAHTVEKRDAEFIAAANPATMLALLDELETKEEQRANWFRMAQKLGEDNGAFTAWKAAGKNKIDWSDYYEFVARWKNHPVFDFAIIPDVIDGGEDENEALLDEWPHGEFYGVPVWHMNESDERFIRLCNEYPRVAIGSCGDYDVKRPNLAVARMKDLIRHVIDEHGQQ